MIRSLWQVTVGICLLASVALATHADKVTYYHNDALGSPIAGRAPNGGVWVEEYGPYGERLIGESSIDNDIWYTGKQEELGMGVQYFHARWYHPALGAFLSRDPAGFRLYNLHSFNHYAYASNNPFKFVDPDGRESRFALRLNNRIQRLGTGQITAEQYRAETEAEGYGAIAGIMMMSPIDEGGLIGLALGKGAGHLLRAGKGAEGVVELTAQQQKAIRSLEKQIAKHEKKLKDFKDNPTVRPGMENQPKDAILKQQRRRVEHLETEITTFRDNIDKIRRGEIDS